MLRISETYWAGKGKLLRLLSELEASGSYLRTLYFTPASLVSPKPRSPASAANLRTSRIDVVLEEKEARDLIPRIKRAGAEGIVEYPLNKAVL